MKVQRCMLNKFNKFKAFYASTSVPLKCKNYSNPSVIKMVWSFEQFNPKMPPWVLGWPGDFFIKTLQFTLKEFAKNVQNSDDIFSLSIIQFATFFQRTQKMHKKIFSTWFHTRTSQYCHRMCFAYEREKNVTMISQIRTEDGERWSAKMSLEMSWDDEHE